MRPPDPPGPPARVEPPASSARRQVGGSRRLPLSVQGSAGSRRSQDIPDAPDTPRTAGSQDIPDVPSAPGPGLTIVLGAALLLRLAHWAAVRQAPFIAQLVMDSAEYDRWARQIAAGDWLGHGVFFQAPLYPYLLACVYQVLGPRLDAVYLLQIGFGVAGCWAVYRAGRHLAGEREGLAAAALAALYGPFLFYDVQLLKESLAATVACFLLWALARVWAPPVPARPAAGWLLAGGLLGVLALLRENALLVVPLLLPLAWWRGGARAEAGRAQRPGEGVSGDETSRQGQALLVPPLGGGAGLPQHDRAGMSERHRAGTSERHRAGASEHDRAGVSRGRRMRASGARSAALLAGTALVLLPVALRNGLVGGAYLPTTFQGGVNFYIGNNAAADGTYRPIVPGKQIPELERREPVRVAEQRLGRRLTPDEVSRYWLGQGVAWAAAHPGDFLRLLWRKIGLFWSWYEWPDAVDYYYLRALSPVFRLPLLEFGGLTLLAALGLGFLPRRGRARRFAPVLAFAAAWMASTVVFFLFARYRLPAVPALMLLAALPVGALAEGLAAGWRDGRYSARTAGLALALAAALGLPRLAGYAPRPDLVHFNLARLAEQRGDAEQARLHYEAVLAASPDDFLAWLDLGNLAARRRDGPQALRCYQRAAALEPASDDAQSNLGGIYLMMGDPAAAADHLARALALNPQSLKALHNSALLRLRLGDPAGARALNDRALAIDPADPAARRLRARLDPSSGSPPAAVP
jgi:tetratricopeptide (TPR) repeat protein